MNALLILTELLDGIERALRTILCRGNHTGRPQKHDKQKPGKNFHMHLGLTEQTWKRGNERFEDSPMLCIGT